MNLNPAFLLDNGYKNIKDSVYEKGDIRVFFYREEPVVFYKYNHVKNVKSLEKFLHLIKKVEDFHKKV